MQVDPNKHPSFCKLLFKEGFMKKMLMPHSFVKKHKKMLAKTCLLKTNAAEMLWEAKIVKENSYYFICEGEWPQFVMQNKLELGDILLFFLIDKSMFNVLVYTQKSYKSFCGGQLYEELSSSSEEQEDSYIGPSRKSKKAKTEPKESSVVAEDEAKSEEEENGQKKTRFSMAGLDNEDPCYELVIKKSHLYAMTIPMSFARWTGIIDMKRVTLVNEIGQEWRVDLTHFGGCLHLRGGWSAFRKYNNICYGDTCLFKLIRRHGGSNVLQVEKVPKSNSI